MIGYHVHVDAPTLRQWEHWLERNPGDDGVTRAARPMTEADRATIREQQIQRMIARKNG